MKHLKTLLSSACCLSICLASFSSFGATGAEAAAGITSDPGTRADYEAKAQMAMATYNKNTKSYEVAVYPVGENVTWDDILDLVLEVNMNLTAAAANSLAALAKIAYLETMSEFTDARFEKLTETVKAAFESLDTIDIEDLSSKVTARLTKSNKTGGGAHYTGYNIFHVAGAQADGKSIVSNSQDRLQLAGFESPGSGIVVKIDDSITYVRMTHTNGVEFASESGESEGHYHGTVGLANWDSPGGACTEYLGDILTGKVDEQDGDHYVLTRHKSGKLHYTKIGRAAGGSAIHFFGTEGDAVVGSGATTNTVTFAKFNDSNIRIKVESDNNGNATITFGVYYQ